jgi:hypothetical protein
MERRYENYPVEAPAKSDAVHIDPVYVRSTRIRAVFTLPTHGTADINILARQLVDGSLFAASDIVSATIEQTSVVNIRRNKVSA